MTVVIVKPGYAPYEAEINGLDEMQEVVGGMIQAIYPFEDRAAVVCNDEGILLGMPYNRSVPGGYGGVFGPFFVCGLGEEDFCSLSPELMKQFEERFHQPEMFVRMGRSIMAMPLPDDKVKSADSIVKETSVPNKSSHDRESL